MHAVIATGFHGEVLTGHFLVLEKIVVTKSKTSGPAAVATGINDVFEKARPTPERVNKYYACRQVTGPKQCADLCIRARSGVDAHRQFFNYYGLNEETHRYRLKVVEVPAGHALIDSAIECQSPRNPQELSLDEKAQQAADDVESLLKGT
jgi:hypothetical protein